MIVVCGEALIDLTAEWPEDQTEGPPHYLPHPGGGPANTALALARLEVPVAFVGRLSTDAFGRQLRRHLESGGVDLGLAPSGDEPTTLAVVHLTPVREAEYSFYVDGTTIGLLSPGDLPASLPAGIEALHTGSLALVLEPSASTLEGLLQREQGRSVLSLDPNVRPALIVDGDGYRRRLEGWLGLFDLVRASRADLAWMYPGQAPEEVARRWLRSGPALVVVTSGGDGALGVCRSGDVALPAPEVQVVDTIGAGDAFNGGLLAWLHRQGGLDRRRLEELTTDELAAALAWAGRVAALTCTRPGADPPRLADLTDPTDAEAVGHPGRRAGGAVGHTGSRAGEATGPGDLADGEAVGHTGLRDGE